MSKDNVLRFEVGDAVSATDGLVIREGNIYEISNPGCGNVINDPTWQRTTIVIRHHEGGFSHWRPSKVTRIRDGYTPSKKWD